MTPTEHTAPDHSQQNDKKKTWLKRIGIAGFLFFLIKGIAWIFVFYFGFKIGGCK